MQTFGNHRWVTGKATRLGAGVLVAASLGVACADPAERPPYTRTDREQQPRPTTPGPVRDDAGVGSGETSGDAVTGSASSSDASGETSSDVAQGDSSGEVPVPAGFSSLRVWAEASLWTSLERMIAASATGEVYVSDGALVYQVVNGEPEVFLDTATLDYDEAFELPGIAVDETGAVHVFVQTASGLVADHLFDAEGNSVQVLPITTDARMRYPTVSRDGDEVYFVADDGLHQVVQGNDRIFVNLGDYGVDATDHCASEALAVGAENLYYLPGCDGSALYAGLLAGGYFDLLAEVSDVEGGVNYIVGMNHYHGFEGIAPHPFGGVVMNFEQLLVRVLDDGSWELYDTSPWPGLVRQEGSPFHGAPVAVDQSSAYLLAENQIWIAQGIFDQ